MTLFVLTSLFFCTEHVCTSIDKVFTMRRYILTLKPINSGLQSLYFKTGMNNSVLGCLSVFCKIELQLLFFLKASEKIEKKRLFLIFFCLFTPGEISGLFMFHIDLHFLVFIY